MRRQASTARQGSAIARALFDGAVLGILELGLDGRVLLANRACGGQLGYEPAELAGRRFADLMHPADAEAAQSALDELSSGQRAGMRLDVRYVRRDGTSGWAALTGERVEADEGPASILVTAEEVTERKEREALAEGERQILERVARGGPLHDTLEAIVLLVESQSDGMLGSILLVDAGGRVHVGAGPSLPADYNAAIEGQPIGPAAGSCGTAAWRGDTVVTPDIATDPLWAEYREVAARAGLASSWSTPLFASDGRVVGTLAQYYRQPQDPAPRDLQLITIARHLAEIAIAREQAEQALVAARNELERRVVERTAELAASETRLRAIVDHTSDVIFLQDLHDRFLLVNGPGAAQLGYTPEALVGLCVDDVLDPESARVVHESNRQVYAAGCARTAEERVIIHGKERIFLATKFPYRAEDGTLLGLGGISRDITERKQAEERLVAERTLQLQATNRELEAFSYSVSHDLRAPLRAIDGFSQALLEDYDARLDDTGRDWLRRVRAASQRMSQLIDDLLQLSRLTRGDMVWSPVDLSALARQSADDLLAAAPDRDIEVVIAPDLRARGDARLLRAALDNLLANAIKFTGHHARARIEVGAVDAGGERAFFVRDDGAGFDMTHAGSLFKPFSRLHDSREFEGSGIGLATVQRIVHRHGGRIWAESAPERGATFLFTLGPGGAP